MVTTATAGQRAQAPGYQTFLAEVARVRRLGPSFVRLTFTGEDLREFGAAGDDQRVKILLPRPGRTEADIPLGSDWYARWQAMPNEARPTLRNYTVRAYRPESGEMDIDFVLHGGADHGPGGPASAWAVHARAGERIGLVGPDRPGSGRMWGCAWTPPEAARAFLLAGDASAVPAIASIVESLPPHARGIACLEVPMAGDEQTWQVPEGFEVRWSVQGAQRPGVKLAASVEQALRELRGRNAPGDAESLEDVDLGSAVLWEVPELDEQISVFDGDLYGWLAGEAEVIKGLRRRLVSTHGLPRTAVAFMGYWRQGSSAPSAN